MLLQPSPHSSPPKRPPASTCHQEQNCLRRLIHKMLIRSLIINWMTMISIMKQLRESYERYCLLHIPAVLWGTSTQQSLIFHRLQSLFAFHLHFLHLFQQPLLNKREHRILHLHELMEQLHVNTNAPSFRRSPWRSLLLTYKLVSLLRQGHVHLIEEGPPSPPVINRSCVVFGCGIWLLKVRVVLLAWRRFGW